MSFIEPDAEEEIHPAISSYAYQLSCLKQAADLWIMILEQSRKERRAREESNGDLGVYLELMNKMENI